MRAWPILLGLAACTDPAIEMRLALPGADAARGFDLSCTGAVTVRIVGNDLGDDKHPGDAVTSCVDLTTPPQSFADLQRAISGRFSFAIPGSGLAAVQIAGFKGRCDDHLESHEAVFYGGAMRGDGDTLAIPVVPNLSCSTARSYNVRVVDLTALTATGSCSTPLDPTAVFAADIRPRMLGDRASRMMLEVGVSIASAPGGTATVASYAAAASDRSCVAVGYQGSLTGGLACVNPTAPTLCGDPGEIEITALPQASASSSTDAALVKQYGSPVFGAVWEPSSSSSSETALAGATVELADPSQGKIVYGDIGFGVPPTVTPIPNAQSTNASGLFIAYIRGEPTNLIVRAPGHATQTLRVASTPDWPSTLIAVLPPL
jgi:hypothetical protein